jgi:hypothetical protein
VNFVCEDLPRHGLLLVPPSSQDYDALLAEIQSRANAPVEGSPPFPERFRPRIIPEDRPTSAILLNRSTKAIVGLQAVWRYETETGRSFRHSSGMLSTMVLLPFNRRDESAMKLYAYWNTILPGSKRYLGESGMVGDNTDVRPPAHDEEWRGGMSGGRGGGGTSSREPIRQVTLALDGVFFLDGEFVGPDGEKMFEHTVADAEAHRIVAKVAKDGHSKGLPPAEILAQIEKITGVAPERPPMLRNFPNAAAKDEDFRAAALQTIAYQLGMRRRFPQGSNDEQTIYSIISWNDVILPNFRKAA